MITQLDELHKTIIDFFKSNDNSSGMTLRELASELEVTHAQTILNKLNQLVRMGYFVKDDKGFRLIKHYNDQEMIYYIPVYGFAQCGNKGTAIVNEYTNEKMPVTLQLVGTMGIENCFFVRARGASMEPKIYEGDLVLIRQQPTYSDSDFVFVEHDGLAKLKKILEKDGKRYLISINKNFEDIEIEEYNPAKIIGVVKKIIKDL